MPKSSVEVEGFSDLERRLKALPQNVAKRGTMRAMKRAADLMAEAIRSRAPRGPTGNLAASIRISARARNLTGLADYSAALAAGGNYRDAQQALRAARSGGESAGTRIFVSIASYAPHAHLVELGTVERFHESGKSTGKMPMNPFFRPAFDATAGQCVMAIRDELTAEVEKMEARGARG